MICELSAKAKPTNGKARIAFFVLLSLAAVAATLYLTVNLYRGIIGLAALGFIVAAIFIYTKYMSAEYYYDITFDYEQTPVFVVRRRTGKKYTTLCRIDLYSIKDVKRETVAEQKAHKTPAGFTKSVYVPTLSPDSTLLITSVTRYEKAEIRIEATDEFRELLLKYSAEAKEARAIAEEEEEY